MRLDRLGEPPASFSLESGTSFLEPMVARKTTKPRFWLVSWELSWICDGDQTFDGCPVEAFGVRKVPQLTCHFRFSVGPPSQMVFTSLNT